MTDNNIASFMGIPLEQTLRQQVFNALQGDVMSLILSEAKVGRAENFWRHRLEGHSFKVDDKISKKLYTIFNGVKHDLGFEGPLDFYITNAPEVNASAISSLEEDEPDIINVNSAMIDLMNDEELKFVIGHEIGHLVSKNTDLHRLIYFVFPPESAVRPGILEHKLRLWNQLSELIADRYGFLACPRLETCVTAFFKLSSGLDARRVDLDVDAFLQENDKRLAYFLNDSGLHLASHPVNPVRVKALELFSRVKPFADNDNGAVFLTQDAFETEMKVLIDLLQRIKNSDLDIHVSYYIAAAGLLVSHIDEKVSEAEFDII